MSEPFSPRVAATVVIIGVASATLALGATALEPAAPPESEAGAHALSDSAVGTRSLLRLLQKLDVPAHVALSDADFRADSVLAIEMLPADASDAYLARAKNHMETAGAALVVLPKWHTRADPEHRGWIESATLLPTAQLDHALAQLGFDCTVSRPAEVSFATPYPVSPTLASPQLIEHCADLDFIVHDPERGLFLGRSSEQFGEVWVLSDPDILSNHGIDDGHNAELAVQILADLAVARDEIVFDETISGLGRELSLWRKLFSPPLSYAALSAILAVLVLVWMGSGRFGAPVGPRPAIAPGKAFLIDNTAALLLHGGHTQHMLSRYFDTALSEVLARHNAEVTMPRPEAIAWLDRLAEARGHHTRLQKVADEVATVSSAPRPSAQRIAACADHIYRWKREMLDS